MSNYIKDYYMKEGRCLKETSLSSPFYSPYFSDSSFSINDSEVKTIEEKASFRAGFHIDRDACRAYDHLCSAPYCYPQYDEKQ